MRGTSDNIQLQYIPQLQLYYDSSRQIYLTPEGNVANMTHTHQPADDQTLNAVKLDSSTVVKIVGFVAMLVMQYALLINKIDDNTEKIQTANTAASQNDKRVKELETNFSKLESQVTISNEIVNQLQIHVNNISNDRKK
jgi:hypothetical protein